MAKTREQIVNEIIKETAKSIPQITNYNTGGVFRLFIEVVAAFLEKIYQALDALNANRFLQTASGQYLDWKAEELGLSRKPAQRAVGWLIFSRKGAQGNAPIPAGKVISTPPDSGGKAYRYTVLEDALIPEGQSEAAALVEAEEEGALYNQPAGRVNILVTPIQGVDSVSNPSDWLTQAGADMESDASLRLRCLSQWGGIGGANSAAYVSWAKSVGGVGQVSIVPTARGAGTVDVVFTAEGNTQPSAELIAQVQSLIDSKRPVSTDALARAPSEVLLNLALNVVFYPNFTPNRALVEAAVYAYFAKLGIGVDFEPSQLIASVQMIEGVKSVEAVEPQRQAVSVLQIARLANLSAAVSNAADA